MAGVGSAGVSLAGRPPGWGLRGLWGPSARAASTHRLRLGAHLWTEDTTNYRRPEKLGAPEDMQLFSHRATAPYGQTILDSAGAPYSSLLAERPQHEHEPQKPAHVNATPSQF